VTDDEQLADRLRSLRNLAFEPGRRFFHREAGFNFRLTNMQAAMGLAQVERIDETVDRKREIAATYAAGFEDVAGVRSQSVPDWARSVYWMNGLVLDRDTGLDAVTLATRLRSAGIDTRPFFIGMHRQPFLLERGLFAGESYPAADEVGEQGLYLPSGVGLSEEEIAAVISATKEALQ
jgi:perosamine synthetase